MASEVTLPPAAAGSKIDHRLLAIAVGLFIAGWLIGQHSGGLLGPQNDRPVLKFLARVAKIGLWVMVAEQPPQDCHDNSYASHGDQINHREGW